MLYTYFFLFIPQAQQYSLSTEPKVSSKDEGRKMSSLTLSVVDIPLSIS